MMKKLNILVAIGAIGAALFVPGGAFAEAKISYGSPLPDNYQNNRNVKEWLNMLVEESDGELSYEFLSGGVVAGAREALASVTNHLVDASYVVDSYTQSELPRQTIATRNGGFGENAMVMAGAANEYMLLNCPECVEDWANNNAISIAYGSGTAYHLACKEPLNTRESLKNKRIRGATSHGVIISTIGAIPVNIPVTDAYEALERGQVDCTMATEGYLDGFSYAEVADYMIEIPLGVYMSSGPFVINKEKWESLSPDIKSLIKEHAAELAAGVTFGQMEEAGKAREKYEGNGVEWLKPDDALWEARDEYLDLVVEKAIKDGKERGIENAEDLVKRFQPIMEKWQAIVDDIGEDKEKYIEALNREIFSKVDY